MIFAIPRRGGRDIFVEVKELDPTNIEVIKNVELDSIFVTPKIKAIKPMLGGFIGLDITKQTLDRDWIIPHGSHILTDKEIGYCIADALITNKLFESEKHGWATNLVNNIFRKGC